MGRREGRGEREEGQDNERWQERQGMRGRNRMQVNRYKTSPPSELVADH